MRRPAEQAERDEGVGRCLIGVGEDCAVVDGGEDELVDNIRAEGVGFVQLAFILGLRAGRIVDRSKQVGIGCLQALIDLEMTEDVVLIAEGLIDTSAQQPLVGEVAGCAEERIALGSPGLGIAPCLTLALL